MRISDWSSDVALPISGAGIEDHLEAGADIGLVLRPTHQFEIGLVGDSVRLFIGGKGRLPHDLLVPHIDIVRHARAGDAGHVLTPGRSDRRVSSIISRVEAPRICVSLITKYQPPCWPGLNLSQVEAKPKPNGSALLYRQSGG